MCFPQEIWTLQKPAGLCGEALANLILQTWAGEAGPMAGWQLERALARGLGPAFADVGALEQSC